MRSFVVVGVLLLSCGPKSPPPTAPVAPPPPSGEPATTVDVPLSAPEPPKLRLPLNVVPQRYAVELHIDPNQSTFAAAIDIDIDVRAATPVVWLHAEDLTVQAAKLDGEPIAALPVTNEFLPLVARAPIATGPHRLRVEYQGKIFDKDTQGLFHQQSGDDWYAFTQFESTDARRAFPCFDEPSFKVPWQLSIHVKKGDIAVANTRVVGQTPGEGGGTVFRFAETPPLPSYLIAFAVGPIEAVDAGKSKSGAPLRILVPRGRGGEAKYAAEITVQIVDTLERYFGRPYPYEKLDSIFIPQTVSFGAMENPGLITYREPIILSKPDEDTVARQRRYAIVAAHEIAHQWFGDLVTLAWWDDIWLNEAFASWAENTVLETWKPEWSKGVERVNDRTNALDADSRLTARQIRQPIETVNDIANAFDGITYSKGSAVISMFELWAGKERFQKGVQRYIAAHANKTATSDDFLAALSAEIGPELETAFRTFLEQPGAPIVRTELRCAKGEPAKLLLRQARYLPAGAQAPKPQLWHIPVCARWSGKGGDGRACTLLTQETGELPLGPACPDFVFPNADAAGYYVTALDGEVRKRVFADPQKLTLVERVGLLADLTMQFDSGAIPAGEALAVLEKLEPAKDRYLTRGALGGWRQAGLLLTIRRVALPDALQPQWARYIQRLFGAEARRLGLVPRRGEDEDTRLLRPLVVGLVGGDGRDKAIGAEATKLAERWLTDKKAVDPEMVGTVLEIAASQGDRSLYERMLAAARETKDVRDRATILTALARFRDPALVQKNHELLLTDAFPIRDAWGLFFAGFGEERTRDASWQWVKTNFDTLSSKLPESARSFLVRAGGSFCDEERQKDVEGFFRDRVGAIRGAPRVLAATLEGIGNCARLRKSQQASVTAYLKKR